MQATKSDTALWSKVVCVLVFMLVCLNGVGQTIDRVLSLSEIDQQYQKHRRDAEKRIAAWLRRNPQAKMSFIENNELHMLVDVNGNGIPEYIKPFNADVAASLSVPQLRVGGSLGLNLLGTGIRIGTWEAGKVRLDHVELVGRVTQVDGATAISDHATHTSGTMIASGVNPAAKGMAPAATLSAFDFNNDVNEMITQAKPDQTTLILSNHSYGSVCGWSGSSWFGDPSVSTTTDYRFGFYDLQSSQWDGIMFSAPYYLIVKAAGNDRGEAGDSSHDKDGGAQGYDCIPTYGVAKNILTVGAVNKLIGNTYTGPNSVIMTSFSGWGPTDDGRIKPDIVAPGKSVLSSITDGANNNQYSVFDGTSMATPAVTGTLALWQQLYKSLNAGNYMRGATLKALAIHTAREAGPNAGPDYQNGYGLLDAEAGAKTILDRDNQNIFVLENVLTSGQVFEMNLGIPKPGTKITATLVWTDPAGAPVAPALNPTTKMLVNDLDLRLIEGTNTPIFPWTLNPASPAAAAVSNADNSRDNVEKIEFSNPQNLVYKLRVTNKGNLFGGLQAYSLILKYSSQIDPLTSYYWIGGSGSWTDVNHWSLTSGGAAGASIPGAIDRTVFDENSFSADNQTVSLPSNQSCYSVRWFATELAALSLNGNTLSVGENFSLLTSTITAPTPGTINLLSANTSTNSVDLNANLLPSLSFVFDGNSSWTVSGTATIESILMKQGALSFVGSSIKTNSLTSSGVTAKTVSFITASLQGASSFTVDFTGITLQSDISSSVVSIPSITQSINFGAAPFQGFVNVQGGDISLAGSSSVRSIQGNGIVRINGSMLISNITLSGGSQLVLQAGATQQFTDKMIFSTSVSSRVIIKSSTASKANLGFNDYYKVCMDHVDVQNVDIAGPSIVTVGTDGTLTNAANWLNLACSNILFPDFSVSYSCVNASVYFTDKSSGTITSRSWSFDDPSSADNTSALVSPVHLFSGAGPFNVQLQLTGPGGTKSATRQVTLASNTLPTNTIQTNNGSLISTAVASTYQWLIDGQIIPSATSRTITNPPSGNLTVLIFNGACNRRSEPFVITAVEDPNDPSQLVKAYPNPASEILQIESPDPLWGVALMDVTGREFPLDLQRITEKLYRTSLSAIPSGMYILKVTNSKTAHFRKIVIRK